MRILKPAREELPCSPGLSGSGRGDLIGCMSQRVPEEEGKEQVTFTEARRHLAFLLQLTLGCLSIVYLSIIYPSVYYLLSSAYSPRFPLSQRTFSAQYTETPLCTNSHLGSSNLINRAKQQPEWKCQLHPTRNGDDSDLYREARDQNTAGLGELRWFRG